MKTKEQLEKIGLELLENGTLEILSEKCANGKVGTTGWTEVTERVANETCSGTIVINESYFAMIFNDGIMIEHLSELDLNYFIKCKAESEAKKAYVHEMEDLSFGVYDESGMCIEPDFKSEDEANLWCLENGYLVL